MIQSLYNLSDKIMTCYLISLNLILFIYQLTDDNDSFWAFLHWPCWLIMQSGHTWLTSIDWNMIQLTWWTKRCFHLFPSQFYPVERKQGTKTYIWRHFDVNIGHVTTKDQKEKKTTKK